MVFKKITSIILVIMTLLLLITFSSCSPKDNPNAEIQLWYYDYGKAYSDKYGDDSKAIISKIESFCKINNIPLKVHVYSMSTLNYPDYALKRNLAIEQGNAIIIEDAKKIWDIANQHADYTKLKNYDNLVDAYKDRFCIPIGIYNLVQIMKKDILDYYEIKVDKSFITYEEYLEIKQEMKEKGAEFHLHSWEINELSDYFLIKNGLRFINSESELFKDSDKFRVALKSAITGMIEDIIKYNNGEIKVDKEGTLYDKKSGLSPYHTDRRAFGLTNYFILTRDFDKYFADNVAFISPNAQRAYSPSFYMHKKITNSRIYEIADYVVNEDSNVRINKIFEASYHPYSPVFTGEITRELFNLDENLKYNGHHKTAQKYAPEKEKEKYIKICKYLDEVYDTLLVDKEKSKLIADYYFTNEEYAMRIKQFVENNAKYFFDYNYDYNSEEEIKKLDSRIDEFVSNFNIHFK